MSASPDFPAGPPPEKPVTDAGELRALLDQIASAPGALRKSVAGLTDTQLDARYRNWTSRQIVHHVADSHTHAYLRFKHALAEPNPTIRPYAENAWASLDDARGAPIETPLALLAGVHASWLVILEGMSLGDYQRTFHHPEHRKDIPLALAVVYYAWHARHHTAQINWLAAHHNWR
jgi:hypothetical protein